MGSFYQPKSYIKGGGSFYQPKTYMKGGMKNTRKYNKKRGYKRKTSKGGFYPTVMTNLVKSGGILMPLAMRAGYSLYNSFSKTRKNKK